MKNNVHSKRSTLLFKRIWCQACLTAIAVSGVCTISAAHAAGTLAGTDIENIATASYDTPGGTVDIPSNIVVIKVDELLDVTVSSSDPGDRTTTPSANGNVLTYQITNTGNGTEAFSLTADVARTGDDFNPVFQQIILDTNNNGVYDAGIDTVYVSGVNDPVLAPDASIKAFVISNTPATPLNGNRAEVGLLAEARTGTGTPGTSFAGQGQGGGNAVVGNTGADADASGFLIVQAATISLAKSAAVVDPFGGSAPVPGAIITYKIVATVSGAGSLANVVIADPIPAGTTFQPASIVYETVSQTDAADSDQSNFNGTRVSAVAGTLNAGDTRTMTFKVKIQ